MKTPKLGREVMAAIGRELRPLYADIVAEGVPHRLAETLRRLDTAVCAGSTDQPMPPAAPSSMEQHLRRDDGPNNSGETHESLSLGASLRRAFALLARGSLRDAPVGLLPTGLASA
jgi:hypothetical protein